MNKNRFKNTTDINICDNSDEEMNLTEDTINDFINFCQSKNITLTKENAPSLHILAKKYVVPLLIDSTNEFMRNYQKEVVVELLLINLKDQHFDTSEYEEIISNDLPYYINDSKLLLFPIPVLSRIMTKYQQKKSTNKNNEPDSTQIIDFLFKCLDKYGKEASVLFAEIDLSHSKNNALNRLLFEYSDKFDFHFINGQLLKTVYELESEIIERAEKVTIENAAHKKEIEKLIQIQKDSNIEKDDQIRQKQAEIESLIQQQQVKNIENEKKIDDLIKQNEEKIRKIQAEFTSKLDTLNDTVRQLSEKVTQQKGVIDQMKPKFEERKISPPIISKRFVSESDPSGIVSILGDNVNVTSSKSDDSGRAIANIKKNDNSEFINLNYSNPQSESDTYIIFDFGDSRRIDLYSYFIRAANYYPKTWRIEGSNDRSQWIPLDRRENNQCLKNDSKNQHHFECQEAKHESNYRYRYIRYVQSDSWYNNDPYRVYFYYFELYGDIFKI